MVNHYSDEKNIQVLLSLLKQSGIRKIIASPGATNLTFVASVQSDDFFEVYSCVDERSAAYMACGMAAESQSPVVLSCTGATASRNYYPGLTEAFYRKLPVLAVTSSQPLGRVGTYAPQVIDRSVMPEDTFNCAVDVPSIHDDEDYWACEHNINKAIIALKKDGGGPARINLVTTYSKNFDATTLPVARKVSFFTQDDDFPKIISDKVGVFVGAHLAWNEKLTHEVDLFCSKYNGVVFCDRTSNYQGDFRVDASLACEQDYYDEPLRHLDVMIHIGQVSGIIGKLDAEHIWRVSEDGELRDPFKKLSAVFEMSELSFFQKMNVIKTTEAVQSTYRDEWNQVIEEFRENMPDLPFSNFWISQRTAPLLPESSVVHLGILNSLRSWNLAPIPKSIRVYSNTGGFGIDGGISSLLGAALCNPQKLYFGFIGDLAFFYDMNALGNRDLGKNIRLLVVNNGKGAEFTNYNHKGAILGENANEFVAARGHFGDKSKSLIKDYATDLGLAYMSASNKEEYNERVDEFVSGTIGEKSILFEVFTDSENESDALRALNQIRFSKKGKVKKQLKSLMNESVLNSLRRNLK